MLLLGDIAVNKSNVLSATTKMIAKRREVEVKETEMMTATKNAMTATSRKLEEAGLLPEPFYPLNILGLNELL
jgi:hypothetical protein